MKRGQRVFLESAFSQLPSAQNNPYAKGAYSGMAFSAILQCPLWEDTVPWAHDLKPCA